MNPEIKAKWVEALRSGKYQQGKRALCRPSTEGDLRYCCLGVLGEELGLLCAQENSSWRIWHKGSNVGSIPSEEAEELGLSEGNQSRLIGMNDNQNKSFNEIADWIEVNL